MRTQVIIASILISVQCAGQGSFSPQAGEPGSNAIPKDYAAFRNWAISCEVERGLRQINLPDSGYASSGSALYAIGKPDAPLTVSLGDGGSATLTFAAPFYDGPGYDFAVFENGFGSGSDAFLELAFVEVSSDGVNFFRFPAISEEQTLSQKESFDNSDATFFHNLAGKHIVNFGTPFDLADLPDTSALDKQNVTHIKVIDVIGNIDPSFASVDFNGTIINDPWPSNFPQGGFDLDAVGVINSRIPLNVNEINERNLTSHVKYDLNGKVISADRIDSYRGVWISADSKGVKLR
ncbi:MAG TPA: secretion protein [Flavobacteriales bacterium]|nr:T9SS C-terminal target domain-containing protein [Salibacteraceae bacterium]MDB0002398.1 T9SS C-terminal target domain-containing protein [Salibacteraceae bacterium]MDB4105723.1 T9SS C-terminal target domain-containing protein [Salibacteraceae bacterium]MDB9710096.1 T9SS C-terminal target domain-containing protein [Salibacteraceae bacterium]HAW18678.1 secretion protein [Flavobacteriales bacterium]